MVEIRQKEASAFENAKALEKILNHLESPHPPVREANLLTQSRLLQGALKKALFRENQLSFPEAIDKYNSLITVIPKDYRGKYLTRLKGMTSGRSNEREKMKSLSGVILELQKIQEVSKNPNVTLDFDLKPFNVDYFGYEKDIKWYEIMLGNEVEVEPEKQLNGELELDIPIRYKGKEKVPYIYEVKDAGGNIYGYKPGKNLNQLLKYNTAVEQGLASSASIEIKGRISSGFLKWIFQEKDRLPNVEIVYNLYLPSGKEFKFVLKPSKNLSLKLESDEKEFSHPEDKQVILGIKKTLSAKNKLIFINMISKFDFEDFTEGVDFNLHRPEEIDNFEELMEYQFAMYSKIWERFANLGKGA